MQMILIIYREFFIYIKCKVCQYGSLSITNVIYKDSYCVRPYRSPLFYFFAFYTCILYDYELRLKRIHDDDDDDIYHTTKTANIKKVIGQV